MHLAEVLDADKEQGEGPESKGKAERVKDLVSQAKQVESKPELAAETTAKLDDAALANATSRPGASKGGPSGNGAKGAKDVTGKDAKGTEPPSAEAKPFSVPAEQQAKLSIEWGIKTDDPKFVYAMTSQATLDFFSRLTPEQRTYLSKNKMKKLEVPSESDIAAVKKQIEEKVKQEAEAQKKKEEAERAKQAKADLDKKHTENKADWAKRKLELREQVRKRVETEMPDYRWEKAFDEIVGVTDEIINKNPTASYDKQVKTAEKKVTARAGPGEEAPGGRGDREEVSEPVFPGDARPEGKGASRPDDVGGRLRAAGAGRPERPAQSEGRDLGEATQAQALSAGQGHPVRTSDIARGSRGALFGRPRRAEVAGRRRRHHPRRLAGRTAARRDSVQAVACDVGDRRRGRGRQSQASAPLLGQGRPAGRLRPVLRRGAPAVEGTRAGQQAARPHRGRDREGPRRRLHRDP